MTRRIKSASFQQDEKNRAPKVHTPQERIGHPRRNQSHAVVQVFPDPRLQLLLRNQGSVQA